MAITPLFYIHSCLYPTLLSPLLLHFIPCNPLPSLHPVLPFFSSLIPLYLHSHYRFAFLPPLSPLSYNTSLPPCPLPPPSPLPASLLPSTPSLTTYTSSISKPPFPPHYRLLSPLSLTPFLLPTLNTPE